jgi:hypothetical protein
VTGVTVVLKDDQEKMNIGEMRSRIGKGDLTKGFRRMKGEGLCLSQADSCVGVGNAINFLLSTTALGHSHPHWQRTESHNRTFLRSTLLTAHDRIPHSSSPIANPIQTWIRKQGLIL